MSGWLGRTRGDALIITLHHVRPHRPIAFAPNAHLEITPEFLDAAIGRLLADGYEPAPLNKLPDLVGRHSGKKRFVAFTLDDGYRNNRDHALPVFERHRVPFTVFVTAGFAERTRSIWWETAAALLARAGSLEHDFGHGRQRLRTATIGEKAHAFSRISQAVRSSSEDEAVARLDETARAAGLEPLDIVRDLTMDRDELTAFSAMPGVSLGAHTLTHPSLAHVDPARLADELVSSANYVAGLTGRRVDIFAYPYGSACACGGREFLAARDAGFKIAVTTQPGMIDQALLGRSPTALPRISLNGHFQKARYVSALATGLPFAFKHRPVSQG
jgi:peptidoglycan/xylan/chitin deacetylase (PgdA/CDA1 family)